MKLKTKRLILTITMILVLVMSIRMQIQTVSSASLGSQKENIVLENQFMSSSLIRTDKSDISIPSITESNVVIDGLIMDNEYGSSITENRSGIEVYWEHDGIDLKIGLVSPGTGWLSFGIGKEMVNSTMIFCGIDGTSTYCYDMLGTVGHGISNDTLNGGDDNIIDYAITESITTIMEVQIPMSSNDTLDPVLTEDEESPFFFAYHATSESLFAMHTTDTRSDTIYVMIGSSEVELNIEDFDRSIPLVEDSVVVIDGIIIADEYQTSFTDQITGIEVYWEHNLEEFKIGLVSPGTGWVAMGIGPNMLQSTMYLGGFENSDSYCVDLDGLEDWLHEEDETDDIIDCAATETEDETTLELIIPMNSTDMQDTDLEVQKVYEMFFAYHISSDDRSEKHTAFSPVISVLVLPNAQSIETFMSYQSNTEVDYNETIFIEIIVTDDNGTLNDVPVIFFMETQYGEIIIAREITDNNGKANASYSNPYLGHEYTFGARSLEMILVKSGEVFAYQSSEFKQNVMFNQKIEYDDRAEYIRLSRVGLLVTFWLAGIVIWGGFGYVFYQLIQIFKGRNEDIEDDPPTDTVLNLSGGNE